MRVIDTCTEFRVRATNSCLSWSSYSPKRNFPGFASTIPDTVKDYNKFCLYIITVQKFNSRIISLISRIVKYFPSENYAVF